MARSRAFHGLPGARGAAFDLAAELGNMQIRRTEVMPPLRDAVSLVYGDGPQPPAG